MYTLHQLLYFINFIFWSQSNATYVLLLHSFGLTSLSLVSAKFFHRAASSIMAMKLRVCRKSNSHLYTDHSVKSSDSHAVPCTYTSVHVHVVVAAVINRCRVLQYGGEENLGAWPNQLIKFTVVDNRVAVGQPGVWPEAGRPDCLA